MSGPALPWAHSPENGAAAENDKSGDRSTDEKKQTILTLDSAGLAVGGRIEVKWVVEPDEGEAYVKWWGATVVGASSKQCSEDPETPVYELSYDEQEDFDQENAHVVFSSEHTLRQLDQEEELQWRKEGDDWDTEGEDGDDEAVAAEDELLTMQDLQKFMTREKQPSGKTIEEEADAAFNSLDPYQRISVAAGFREFADELVNFLRENMGDGTTVTEEHVRAFMEKQKSKRQRTL